MTPSRLRFAGFAFDPATGDLSGPEGDVRLQPQPARVLAVLAARSGTLVTREELQAQVWPDTKVEFDQGINYCIRQIRSALGERADAPRFIETLPRRGYRFLVPVETEGAALSPAAAGPGVAAGGPLAADAGAAAPGAASARPRRPWRWAAGVGLVGLLGLFAWNRAITPPTPVGPGPERWIVLPLSDPDSPGGLDRLNRGVEEALVAELTAARPDRLAVVGPLTTGPLVEGGATAAEVGARLEAGYVVSGGARAADSVLFVQVVRHSDGAHVFARRVPLQGRDAAALARELVGEIIAAVLPTAPRLP